MASDEGATIAWTHEQRSVIEASIDARISVTAGAGTGKTAVLIARLAHLIASGAANPGSELLVLTFSRAAVAEIRGRLARQAGDSSYVRVQTFDSFATRLLATFSVDEAWTRSDYDERIRRGAALLGDESVRDVLASFRHLFIDEMQDLVGRRLEFVLMLLDSLKCGFTLFCDRAQSIYEYQLRSSKSKVTDALLLVTSRHPEIESKMFSSNFRARTERAKCALKFGPALAATVPNFVTAGYELQSVLLGLPSHSLRDLVKICRIIPKRTAILCRTNGQALMVSRDLHRAGLQHELRRAATDRCVSSWLGATFGTYPYEQISKKRALQLIEEIAPSDCPDGEAVWRLLKRADGRAAADVSLRTLADRLRRGDSPDELSPEPSEAVVVSTVHRAKGREFDRVVVCGFDELEPYSEGYGDEVRLLYVALTRTTGELVHLGAPDTKFMSGKDNPGERWVQRTTWHGRPTAIEVRGSDSHWEDPAGAYLIGEIDVPDTQTYLRQEVKRGDPVDAVLIRSSLEGQPRAFYRVDHCGRPVAVTSETFGRDLHSTMKAFAMRFPSAIRDLSIEAIDTVAGSQASASRSGLGASGLFLRARVVGLGTLAWEPSIGTDP